MYRWKVRKIEEIEDAVVVEEEDDEEDEKGHADRLSCFLLWEWSLLFFLRFSFSLLLSGSSRVAQER